LGQKYQNFITGRIHRIADCDEADIPGADVTEAVDKEN
jgi:hypothetical protein